MSMRVLDVIPEARVGSIPNSWMGITNRMDPAALLALRTEVQEQGVDPGDTEAVGRVWWSMVANASSRVEALKAEAAKDREEYEKRAAHRASELEQLSVIVKGQPKKPR